MNFSENLIDTKIQAIAYDIAIEKLEAVIKSDNPNIQPEQLEGLEAALMIIQTSYMEAQDRYENS